MPSPKMSIDDMESRAPNSLQHARTILNNTINNAEKILASIERQFYGSKNGRIEISKKARMITKIMKQVNLSWLTEPIHIDRLATRALYNDTDDSDLTPIIKQIREFYDKTWKAVPTDLQPVIDRIELVLKHLRQYCPPLYNATTDPHIQIAKDYEIKYKSRTADIRKYLDHVSNLFEKFKRGQMYLDEMSQNTREFAMKLEAEDCPFVFAFFESCECLREAMKAEKEWLVVANEYTYFLESEVKDLTSRRNSLQSKAMKQQDKYNKENYRLQTLAQEIDTQTPDQAVLQSKEMGLLVREEVLLGRVAEMRLDFDIKEFRLAEMKRTVNPKTASLSAVDAMNKLADEVKVEGQVLTDIHKELNLIKLKTAQLVEKQSQYRKMTRDYDELNKQVKSDHRSYLATHKQLREISRTIEHIKYMVQYLDTPDTAQKIFLDLPRRREALGVSRSHGLNLQSAPDDILDRVFDMLSERLGMKWVNMYRELPFYPPRGYRTIENDITILQSDCMRDSLNKEVKKSLERWRRFHTRAKAADLLPVLRKMGETEILQDIDKIVNPPRPKTPVVERLPTFLEDKLIPFYQQVARYDMLRMSKKSQTPSLPNIHKKQRTIVTS